MVSGENERSVKRSQGPWTSLGGLRLTVKFKRDTHLPGHFIEIFKTFQMTETIKQSVKKTS